jgi:hypothetical protein
MAVRDRIPTLGRRPTSGTDGWTAAQFGTMEDGAATNRDAVLEAVTNPRVLTTHQPHERCQPDVRYVRSGMFGSVPHAAPKIQFASLSGTPSMTRRWHDATRAASPIERTNLNRHLYATTGSFSPASASDLLKLLSGRTPRPRSENASRDRVRLHSLWARLFSHRHLGRTGSAGRHGGPRRHADPDPRTQGSRTPVARTQACGEALTAPLVRGRQCRTRRRDHASRAAHLDLQIRTSTGNEPPLTI